MDQSDSDWYTHEHVKSVIISATVVISVQYALASGLELMVLFAYF